MLDTEERQHYAALVHGRKISFPSYKLTTAETISVRVAIDIDDNFMTANK